MTDRYVGIGGNDGNSGLTWALRKLTLNGAEDTPVVADDTVYVGPGAYRELLTCDVSGGAGTPIVYIADVTGENTDQVGGIVRITGSDNDQTAARANCITANAIDYRTFRGFTFDTVTTTLANCAGGIENWIIEDSSFQTAGICISVAGDCSTNIIRRCLFMASIRGIAFSGLFDDTAQVVENCVFLIGSAGRGVNVEQSGGIAIQNCSFVFCATGVRVSVNLNVGQTLDVENCIFFANAVALRSTAVAYLVEDFNTFYANGSDRNTVNVGGNSQTYPPLLAFPILQSGASQVSGFKFPWWFGELGEWSQIRAIAGASERTEGLRGIVRPTTAAKNSWGATQFFDAERETGTVRTGSVSITLHDAGSHQIWVPVANESTTISVWVYREANYAGTNPRLVVKQPGQADDTTTDAAAASQWNELTTTLTPAADPPYVVVELQSLNTAVALAFDIFFDDLTVS